MELLIATTNAGKIKEIEHELDAAGLRALGVHARGLKDLPAGWVDCAEDQPTFIGNAAKKARHFARISGMLTLADDSGLCVDALGGAPGVISARYAGEPCDNAANNAKLLREMAAVADGSRGARFVCAMALAMPGRKAEAVGHTEAAIDLHVVMDEIVGEILRAPRGGNGFGYDPLFLHPPLGKTTAELEMAEKSQVSHRGKALRRMIEWLRAALPRLREPGQ